MIEITEDNCAEAIDWICEEAGVTKKQLADFLGVAPSNITRIQKKIIDGKKVKAGEDFLNRMKALQVLGYAKYRELLSSGGTIDPDLLSGKSLTVSGVLTGLTAIASLKSLIGVTAISIPLLGMGPALAGGLLAGGLYKGLSIICKKNELHLDENGKNLEIKPIKEKGELT